jgi:hypothetical protein
MGQSPTGRHRPSRGPFASLVNSRGLAVTAVAALRATSARRLSAGGSGAAPAELFDAGEVPVEVVFATAPFPRIGAGDKTG